MTEPIVAVRCFAESPDRAAVLNAFWLCLRRYECTSDFMYSAHDDKALVFALPYVIYHHHHHHHHHVLTESSSPWHSSQTSCDPHRSGCKLHTAVLSLFCDVPSTAVFCSESIECFPGMAFRFFFQTYVIIPVARVITGIITHFMFHIRCISIHKLLYFSFFSASFFMTFLSACIASSIRVHIFSFLFLIIISGLFAITSLCCCFSCCSYSCLLSSKFFYVWGQPSVQNVSFC